MRLKNLARSLQVLHDEDEGLFFTTRRKVLYSRILLLTGLAVFLTLIKDVIDQGLAPVPIAVFTLFIIILLAVVLNGMGKQLISKIIFLLLLNVIIGLLCSVIPKERFAFIFFFPLIVMAYVIFQEEEIVWRNIFVMVASTILILLVLTDFKLFWDYQLSVSGLGQKNFIINVIVTILIISLCVDFLVRTNKRAEDALAGQAKHIEEKNRELQKINAELDRFVYSASHDLRAPLLSIQGLSKIAIAESESENDKKYFSLIHERVIKLDEFIKDIIEYSKNARTELKIETFDIRVLIEEIIDNLRYLQGADKIQFSVQPDMALLSTDRSRLKIILSNIIANAIKYSNPRIENPLIGISVHQKEQFYIISVEDNGVGIPDEAKARIFEMFYRASDKSSGSGLGLYIAKEMVQKLEGTVSVESALGSGSLFSVHIPVMEGHE